MWATGGHRDESGAIEAGQEVAADDVTHGVVGSREDRLLVRIVGRNIARSKHRPQE